MRSWLYEDGIRVELLVVLDAETFKIESLECLMKSEQNLSSWKHIKDTL